jgi:large subunit ribosomal protein L35
MPKIKTNRGAAKRFKLTAKGKVKYHRSNLRHILTTKNRKRKRRLSKAAQLGPSAAKTIKRLLPYL